MALSELLHFVADDCHFVMSSLTRRWHLASLLQAATFCSRFAGRETESCLSFGPGKYKINRTTIPALVATAENWSRGCLDVVSTKNRELVWCFRPVPGEGVEQGLAHVTVKTSHRITRPTVRRKLIFNSTDIRLGTRNRHSSRSRTHHTVNFGTSCLWLYRIQYDSGRPCR